MRNDTDSSITFTDASGTHTLTTINTARARDIAEANEHAAEADRGACLSAVMALALESTELADRGTPLTCGHDDGTHPHHRNYCEGEAMRHGDVCSLGWPSSMTLADAAASASLIAEVNAHGGLVGSVIVAAITDEFSDALTATDAAAARELDHDDNADDDLYRTWEALDRLSAGIPPSDRDGPLLPLAGDFPGVTRFLASSHALAQWLSFDANCRDVVFFDADDNNCLSISFKSPDVMTEDVFVVLGNQ